MKLSTVFAVSALISSSLFSHFSYAEGRSIEYGEMNQVRDIATNQTKSKYFKTAFKLKINNPDIKFSDVKIWLEREGQVIANAVIDIEGNISLPILPQDEAEKTMLHTNKNKDDVGISLYTDVIPLDSALLKYSDVFVLLDDINAFTEQMAGGFSMFIPSMDEIKFTFDAPATITVKDSKGKTKTYKTDDDFVIEIPKKKRWMQSDTWLQFSALPTRYEPIN
ncbi:hypothetical protein [Pseudoalteromonas phenolica]|uniref:DUF2987 domain-containing protein n=1 Tax=Pseudoalteromonas phenolica TaxID=161398 RepID=A0A0S2K752_9GAMM|nr:hypothetical protein [Pseudoalteromonas phenolica]ALO43918.1 hypothetical protein PP2015_3443 [Pseudoalteromonas phenolica]MBE0356889.1 hypothetical protein [Pseudoalteromonas phenolica O-BC30]RXE95794.1 hypothetical protein D9981_14275 [Pseudoalteromonas phenolica O-BC30]